MTYDLIVKIDSLQDLQNKGWEIVYNQNEKITKEDIIASMKKDKILIGVIGFENVGKTYLLNKFCGESLPYGYNYHTEGLSFKICDDTELPFIYADAAGCGKPFLYNQRNDQNSTENNANDDAKYTIVNDRIMTETLIQDFILENCNIIMIILNQLTQEYQKMIERIIRNYSDKEIFIIHNFSNLGMIDSVKDKIKRDVINSFPVEEKPLIGFDNKNSEHRNKIQYIE